LAMKSKGPARVPLKRPQNWAQSRRGTQTEEKKRGGISTGGSSIGKPAQGVYRKKGAECIIAALSLSKTTKKEKGGGRKGDGSKKDQPARQGKGEKAQTVWSGGKIWRTHGGNHPHDASFSGAAGKNLREEIQS